MMMDCASAELCKYAANAMLATRISFMNEVANVCEAVGADVDHVRRAVASDRRIGPAFLFPGVGYGGSCFPKDVKAIMQFAAAKNYEFQILRAVESVNERQKVRLIAKMKQHFGSLKGKRIAVWGLAFKPKTDDMREAPAVPLITALLDAGRDRDRLRSGGDEGGADIFGTRVIFADKSYDALSGADGAGDRDGVVRVPRAGLEQDQEADADAGHLRRPQPLQPGSAARPRLHLPVDGPPVSVLVTGGAGYIGSHAVKALRAAGQDVVIYDNLSAGHEAAATAGRARRSKIGEIQRRARGCARSSQAHRVDAVMHFAALALGRRIGEGRRSRYYENNVGGRAGRVARRWSRPASRISSSRPRPRPSGTRSRRRSPKAIRSARSTPTARPSSPSSARCRTSSGPTGSAR